MSNFPQDTPYKLHISCGSYGYLTMNLADLIDQIEKHFGEETKLSDIDIASEYIHTLNTEYDRYDSSDYECYIVITKRIE